MEGLIETGFVKPHYIEELGCEGLWDDEIAKSLGASPHHVRQKLKKGKWSHLPEWQARAFPHMSENNRKTHRYAMITEAAKVAIAPAFVACMIFALIMMFFVRVLHGLRKTE